MAAPARLFRGQLLYKPNERFNLRWIGDYNEVYRSAGTRVLYSTGPTINGTNVYESRAAAAGDPGPAVRTRRINLDNDQHAAVVGRRLRLRPTGPCPATSP